MRAQLRPVSAVPAWVSAVLAVGLGLQIAWQTTRPATASRMELPEAPRREALRLASLGEEAALARLAMLYLQSFDYHANNPTSYRNLDYARLTAWLDTILAVDPRSDYPLFSAARIYAENPDPERSRQMLQFVYREFLDDPNRRWPWLAHAAVIAKHRLKDLPLALRYARAVQEHARDADVPSWAKQMEIFILQDMNELQAARTMILGLLESGRIHDPAEILFLRQRLRELAARERGEASDSRHRR
jgi:hypothetical protein